MKSSLSLGRELIGGADSLAVEAYRQRLLNALNIKPGKGLKALDLGCGDGLEAIFLAKLGYQVEALDLEPHADWDKVSKVWKGKIKFRIGDAASLRKIRGKYDLVFEKDMLHHVPRPLDVMAEMKRLVKKGGSVYVVECNRYNPIFYLHLTLMGGHQHFSREKLKSLLDAAAWDNYSLVLKEARVWPIENLGFQKLMDLVQDAIEAVKILNPWICYHLVTWEKKHG